MCWMDSGAACGAGSTARILNGPVTGSGGAGSRQGEQNSQVLDGPVLIVDGLRGSMRGGQHSQVLGPVL